MSSSTCMICDSWPDYLKFSDNDLFDLISVSTDNDAMYKWLKWHRPRLVPIKGTLNGICEVHFGKNDYVREIDTQGLVSLRLISNKIRPTFVNYEECLANNKICSYTAFLLDYHKCLNTQPNWNMDATEDEVTFMLRNSEVIIRVNALMRVTLQEGLTTFEQGSILESHLNNGKLEYWSKMRSLMLFCEENSPLTDVMTRLGATLVLQSNEHVTSLNDVLCFAKAVLDESWFYEFLESFIVGFVISPFGSPQISKSIKVYPDFGMTGYLGNELIGTKNIGTIRFLQEMNNQPVEEFTEENLEDANWDVSALDVTNSDHIHSFEALIENISDHMMPEWQFAVFENHFLLYKTDMTRIPKLKCVVKINRKLHCTIFVNDAEIVMDSVLQGCLSFTMLEVLMNDVSQIEDSMSLAENVLEEGEIPAQKRPIEESDLGMTKKVCVDSDSDLEIITDDPLSIDQPPPPPSPPDDPNMLKCPECGEIKANQSALTRHLIKHKTEFVCQLCSSIFASPSDLRSHMDSKHTAPSNYKCKICDSPFMMKGDLMKHMKETHNQVQRKCLVCQESCENIYVLNRHVKEAHIMYDANGRAICPVCHVTFNFVYSVARHLNEVHTKNPMVHHLQSEWNGANSVFTCKICGLDASEYGIILGHLKTHFTEGSHFVEEQVVIDLDEEEEPEEGEMIMDNQEEETNYELEYRQGFQELEEGEEFVNSVSLEDGLWHCQLCAYKGKTERLLKGHQLYHRSDHRCGICGRYFPGNFHLQRHMKSHLSEGYEITETEYLTIDVPDEGTDEIEIVKEEIIG